MIAMFFYFTDMLGSHPRLKGLLWQQVEKAPTVIKAGLKKEEAEELKKKIEAGLPSPTAHQEKH